MSDDDDDPLDSDSNLFDGGLDGPDTMGFGPLVPTESERSLMERVRQELKHELKQVSVNKYSSISGGWGRTFQVHSTKTFLLFAP